MKKLCDYLPRLSVCLWGSFKHHTFTEGLALRSRQLRQLSRSHRACSLGRGSLCGNRFQHYDAVMEAVGCRSLKEDVSGWWACRSTEKLQRGKNGLAGLKEIQNGKDFQRLEHYVQRH